MFRSLIEQIAGPLATASVVLFFASFMAVLWYVWRDPRRAHRERMCAMALEGDEREELDRG